MATKPKSGAKKSAPSKKTPARAAASGGRSNVAKTGEGAKRSTGMGLKAGGRKTPGKEGAPR